jgi:hypothetical protein
MTVTYRQCKVVSTLCMVHASYRGSRNGGFSVHVAGLGALATVRAAWTHCHVSTGNRFRQHQAKHSAVPGPVAVGDRGRRVKLEPRKTPVGRVEDFFAQRIR